MRYDDWPQRLATAIEAAELRSFAFGSVDCCLFAADVVLAMTGTDYAAKFRGYDSKVSAYRIVAEHGSLSALITSVLGQPIEPAYAGRGDVVLANIPGVDGEGETTGICLGARCAFPKDVGIVLHPRSVVRAAWKIA